MHEKLIVWKEAYALCLGLYALTNTFPSEERYGLFSQMRRAAFSIPANIAEGNARKSIKDKMHFLVIASASLEEIHVSLSLARDLQYISVNEFCSTMTIMGRVSYLILQLQKTLEKQI